MEQQGQRLLDELTPIAAPRTAEVHLASPVDLPGSLAPLARYGDDLLDRFDGRTVRRAVPLANGEHTAYAAEIGGDNDDPVLAVRVAHAADLEPAVAAVSDHLLFSQPAALLELCAADPLVALLERRHRGLRQLRYPDLYEALVRSISAQQVNLRWASTTRRRLADAFGTAHHLGGGPDDLAVALDPRRLAGVTVAEIRALQFTTRKAEYIVSTAEEIASGHLDPAELASLPDTEVVARLSALRGIGRWTAEWILARTLGRAVVVAGDLGVRKVVAQAYAGLPIADEREVRRLTAHWGEAATAAQWLLLDASFRGDDLVALGAAARG